MPQRTFACLILVIWLGASLWWLALGRPSPHLPTIHVTAPVLVRPVPSITSFAKAALSPAHLPKSVTLEGITVAVVPSSPTTARLCLPSSCAIINLKTRSVQKVAP